MKVIHPHKPNYTKSQHWQIKSTIQGSFSNNETVQIHNTSKLLICASCLNQQFANACFFLLWFYSKPICSWFSMCRFIAKLVSVLSLETRNNCLNPASFSNKKTTRCASCVFSIVLSLQVQVTRNQQCMLVVHHAVLCIVSSLLTRNQQCCLLPTMYWCITSSLTTQVTRNK